MYGVSSFTPSEIFLSNRQCPPMAGIKRFLSALNSFISLEGNVSWVDCISIPVDKNADALSRMVTSRAGLSEQASRLLPKATPAPDLAMFAGSEPGSQMACPLTTVWAAHRLATIKRILGKVLVAWAVNLVSPNLPSLNS